jgi:hypothetical protein
MKPDEQKKHANGGNNKETIYAPIGVTLHYFVSHFLFLSVVSPLAVDNGVTPTGFKAARIIVIIVAYMREIVCLCTVACL